MNSNSAKWVQRKEQRLSGPQWGRTLDHWAKISCSIYNGQLQSKLANSIKYISKPLNTVNFQPLQCLPDRRCRGNAPPHGLWEYRHLCQTRRVSGFLAFFQHNVNVVIGQFSIKTMQTFRTLHCLPRPPTPGSSNRLGEFNPCQGNSWPGTILYIVLYLHIPKKQLLAGPSARMPRCPCQWCHKSPPLGSHPEENTCKCDERNKHWAQHDSGSRCS